MRIKECRVNEHGDFDILLSFSKKDVKRMTGHNSPYFQLLGPGHIERLYEDIVTTFLQSRAKFIGAVGFGDTNFSEIKVKCIEHNVWHTADKDCPVCIAASAAIRKERI